MSSENETEAERWRRMPLGRPVLEGVIQTQETMNPRTAPPRAALRGECPRPKRR